jgi:hypothetical protein
MWIDPLVGDLRMSVHHSPATLKGRNSRRGSIAQIAQRIMPRVPSTELADNEMQSTIL